MNVNYKDIGIRALKTFVQSFLAVVVVGLTAVDSLDALIALIVAGLAAGISATWNWIKETL